MKQFIEVEVDEVERTCDILVEPFLMMHTTTCSQIWSSAQACNIKIQYVGNRVTLTFPKVLVTATTPNYIKIDTVLPVEVRPEQDHFSAMHIVNNGIVEHGTLHIKTSGDISFHAGLNMDLFTGAGISGFESHSVTYVL